MDLFTVILVAIGISLDTFTISATRGIYLNEFKIKSAIIIASYFTVFQVLMIFLGWLTGEQFTEFLNHFSHWIVFLVLFVLGIKMLYDSRKKRRGIQPKLHPLSFSVMIPLAFVASIDAFVIGAGFTVLSLSILSTTLIIAVVTFASSIIGIYIGKALGENFEKSAELIGGVVLIVLALLTVVIKYTTNN